MTKTLERDFYVVAREPGAENPSLPTWASRGNNPMGLREDYPSEQIIRQDVEQVPGAFQLLNVFSPEECAQFIQASESLGYLKDAAVSLPREIRHNHNVTWVSDEQTDALIWQRVQHLCQQNPEMFEHKAPLGINARFRFYRYGTGDFFKNHVDGAWPGSRVVDDQLIADAYGDRYSQMTFLIFLNDDFEGGATRFLVNAEQPDLPARGAALRDPSKVKEIDVRTPAGGVLCFPHGHHPLHCIHGSEPILQGQKYIVRTDMLFQL